MALRVLLTGTSLYIRQPNFRTGFDKVWRVLTPVGGPVDLLGERLIPTATSDSGVLAAYAAGTVLTNGNEESPVVFQNNKFVGGNHLCGNVPSILNWTLIIALDNRIVAPNAWVSGAQLVLYEKYNIRDSAGGVALIERKINRTWGVLPYFNYTDSIWCLKPFTLQWFSGTQAQRPAVAPGQTLRLQIPGASLDGYGASGGVDVTDLRTEVLLTRDQWLTQHPPHHFKNTVMQGSSALFTLAQGFASTQYRGDMSVAYMRSIYSKNYPRGIEFASGRPMKPGENFYVIGYQGCYNGV